MELDEIVRRVGKKTELEGNGSIHFPLEYAYFDLAKEIVFYGTNNPLESRRIFHGLAERFPWNRFVDGFRHGLLEKSLEELHRIKQDHGKMVLSLSYLDTEVGDIIELLREYP